jgi:hypothetical protein
MPGMMMKKDKPAAMPMAYKKGGAVKKPMPYEKGGMVPKAMHKMPDGKMMPGGKHGSAKTKK